MRIEGKKEGSLVDEVVAGIAHEANAIQYPAADEFRCNDHGIDG